MSRHIIPQITRFNVALQQQETKARLAEKMMSQINNDPFKMALVQKSEVDLTKLLKETFEGLPLIAIVIDQKTPDLEPICNSLPFKTAITEFRTFSRENALNVHIHLFNPVRKGPELPKLLSNILIVFQLVYRRGKTYDEAVKLSAKKLGLGESSLRAMYTRDMGLTAKELRKLMVSSERVKELLVGRFPEYKNGIIETF